jgi:putative tryptophan/tyrosine transport system substrate-binding protein
MRRREFVISLGGAAAVHVIWAGAAQGQQPSHARRIGVLLGVLAADDPEGQARLTAFVQGLQALGWTDGLNLRIDYRWGLGDRDRLHRHAAELVALTPDIILAGGNSALAALQQATSTVPVPCRNRSCCAPTR